MTLIEFIITVSLTANFVTMVALKYHIEDWYLRQNTPSWFPESFCLMCFAFWTGLLCSIIYYIFLPIDLHYIVISSICTPSIVVLLNKITL